MISLSSLRFGYGRDELVFDGLDHVFGSGVMSVVTGRSGCGKSTLLYLAGLLLTPRQGRVTVGSVDAGGLSDGARSRLRAGLIGFVFQDAALDATRSVLDNVVEGGLYAGMPRRAAETRARQLLDQFGVELRQDNRPGEVSGGQAQRVGLCRALVKDPAVILADEPTGNLDSASAAVVIDALAEAASGGATVVVASHDPVIAARADDVFSL